MAATYQATTGQAGDYDISTASGWGPDFTDPSSYLNIYDSRTGDMIHTLGLEASSIVQGKDPSTDAKKAIKLSEYDALLDKASAITDDVNARYTAYADAGSMVVGQRFASTDLLRRRYTTCNECRSIQCPLWLGWDRSKQT